MNESAQGICERMAKTHYENFPVGSRFIPREHRPAIHAIYAFARCADDFADELVIDGERPSPARRRELLNEWERRLETCYEGHPEGPVFTALFEAVQRYELPKHLLLDLLTAFKMDVAKNRYKNFEELLFYCRHSANPIGRLVLWVHGYKDEERARLADFICTALQLANHWQDVSVDLLKDRVYLPEEDIKRFGYSYEDLFAKRTNPSFTNPLRFQVERTRDIFHQGSPLLKRLGKDLSFEIRLTYEGGMRILEKIERQGFDVFRARPVLRLPDKVIVLFRAWQRGRNGWV